MNNSRNIQIAVPSTGEEEWQAVRAPLMSGWLTQGPKVVEFEQAFATRHQVKHAIATSNCTTALHLLLTAAGVGPGDEVIVPAFTWISTANVVLYCGAKPVFVDIDRATYTLDASQVASKITERTKAIIPVHLFGLCADMDALAAAAPGIALFEDAACAVGAVYKGRSAGSLGLAAAFSFHPRKTITTGEGGMITTNDDQIADMVKMLRNHGASVSEEQRHLGPKPYILPDFNLLGFNYRMTDLQGAVGLVQLSKLEQFLVERQQWAALYEEAFADIPWLRTPRTPEGLRHGWQAYVCYVDEQQAPMPRNALMEYLQAKGISTRPGTHAVHQLNYYRRQFGLQPADYPASRDCDAYSIALPLHNRMSAEDIHYVVQSIRECQ